MKVSKQNIEACVSSFKQQLESEGYTQGLRLYAGSPSNGLAWRLSFEDGSEVPGLFQGYLGWTKEEAWRTLSTMTRLMVDLWEHEREMMAERDH